MFQLDASLLVECMVFGSATAGMKSDIVLLKYKIELTNGALLCVECCFASWTQLHWSLVDVEFVRSSLLSPSSDGP